MGGMQGCRRWQAGKGRRDVLVLTTLAGIGSQRASLLASMTTSQIRSVSQVLLRIGRL